MNSGGRREPGRLDRGSIAVATAAFSLVAVFAGGMFAGWVELSGINRELGTLVARDDEILRRLDDLESHAGRVDDRLDGIDDRLDGIDDRLDGIDDRLDGIDGQLEALTGSITAGLAEIRSELVRLGTAPGQGGPAEP